MLKSVSARQIIDFSKNLSVMLKSGITIDEALGLLIDQSKSRKFRNIVQQVKKDVEMGTSLGNAFGKHEDVFGRIFLVFLRAGEKSGTMETNLTFLADWMERNNDLKRDVNAATLYPKIVLTATFLLGGGLAVFILPRLSVLFSQLDIQLPIFTRILLAISLFVQQYWLVVLLAIIALILAFIFINKLKPVRRIFHWLYLRMPFVGEMLVDYQLALLSQLFHILLKSGLSINESLEIASEAPNNILYQESVENSRKRVIKGTAFSKALQDYPELYPKNMLSIIITGEKSGTLEDSFSYLAEFYSKEVNIKTKKLPTVIEPALLIIIGLILGFVAISIIMPIYQITRGFGQ
ncbi:type II secretion system F family protein [Patescibacteria group bacterium]|nr:type II secretion system F family protein [Patescibacteria group bacterium]